MAKKLVLFVVDALMQKVVAKSVRAGKLTRFSALLSRRGRLKRCLSIFPSITPAATCSIATGAYPREHGIGGASWWNPLTNRAEYFGDDRRLIFQQGIHQFLVDFGDRMNFELLKRPLLGEILASQGIDSACINYMWFKGPCRHDRRTPLGLRIAAGELSPEVHGVKYLKLGDFVHALPRDAGDVSAPKSGVFQRYGFHDETTAACMLAMARNDCLPDFSIAYFPLNDSEGHTSGLDHAADVHLQAFDDFLGEFIEAVGGWDSFESQYEVIVVGDHGQTDSGDGGPDVVRLDERLSDFRQAESAIGFDGEEILICPNMRSAAIHVSDETEFHREQVIDELLSCEGVDQVIYDERNSNGRSTYTVRTADRGRMSFCAAGDGGDRACNGVDAFGNRWSIHGETRALDVTLENGRVVDGDYPNALERISGVFSQTQSPIWVTARPGVEFAIAETATHPRGSHGSLFIDDTEAALLVSDGTSLDRLPNPDTPRIVDVLQLCLDHFGIELPTDLEDLNTEQPAHAN